MIGLCEGRRAPPGGANPKAIPDPRPLVSRLAVCYLPLSVNPRWAMCVSFWTA